MTNYKRISREMPQCVKDKISQKLKGRKLSDETKLKISNGQKAAWAKIPQTQRAESIWGTDTNNENKMKSDGDKEKN